MADVDYDELYKAMKAVALREEGTVDDAKYTEEEPEVDLEKMFLTPSNRFSEHWLNKLQQFALHLKTC
jgi:hypothetical protein